MGILYTLGVLLVQMILIHIFPIALAGCLGVFGIILGFILYFPKIPYKVPVTVGIFIPMVSCFWMVMSNDAIILGLGSSANRIPIAEISKYPDATWISFSDVLLHADLAYTHYTH